MAKGYWMFHTTVSDPETYKKYVERDGAAFAKYGARFLARGGEFQAVEGSMKRPWPASIPQSIRRRRNFAEPRRSPIW